MRLPKPLLNVFLAMSVGCIALLSSAAPEAKAEIEIEVSLKERYLWLRDSGNVVKRYPIAIGAPESSTIPGVFSILKKVKDPSRI